MSGVLDPLTLPLQGTRLIEASAGTGKTFTLAGLVTRYIAEGAATLDQMLLITFSRAATQELRDRVREIRPGLRCLFMSGYPADALSPSGILEGGDELLQKPFTLEALSRRIAKVLGTGPAPAG